MATHTERTADPQQTTDVRARRPGLDPKVFFHRARRVLSALVLVLLDIGGATLGLYAALVLKQAYRGQVWLGIPWDAVTEWLQFIVLVMVLVFAKNGLYRARESRPGTATVIQSLALVSLICGLYAIFVSGKTFNSYYAVIWVTAIVTTVLIVLLRASYDSITLELMRVFGIKRRTLLAGAASDLATLRRTIASDSRGPEVVMIGAVSEHGDDIALDGVPTLGSLADLPELLARERPNDLIVAGVEMDGPKLLELVDVCREHGTRLRIVPRTSELLLERAVLVPGQAVPLFEVRPPVFAGLDWAVKRSFDLVVSALLLAVLAIPGLLVCLLVRLTSEGPALYRDRRIGVGERPFDVLKLRSMYADAAERQEQLEQHNEADGAIFKMRRDPRVTPVGRVLRRLSIDELPQLVNVLRGEMSLVGPRPLPIRDYELLETWHRGRYRVLPGITGLWQVSGRSELSFDELVRLDFYYVENWSVWVDITILLRTPLAVARGRGAY